MPPTPSTVDPVFTPPSHKQWKEAALAGLPEGHTFELLQHTTLDGLVVSVLYDQAPSLERSTDLTDTLDPDALQNGADNVPENSKQPITETTFWDNRLAVYSTQDNATANRQILAGLNGGNTSIQIQARPGDTFGTLLNGVKLDIAGTHFLCELEYETITQNFATHVEAQALDPATVTCSFNADPIGHWLATGVEPPAIEELIEHLGRFSVTTRGTFAQSLSVLVDASIHHNAGASVTQELHAAIATGTLYLQALLESGMSLQQAVRQIVFKVSCDADMLMGVVKIRSLDTLWAHVVTQFATREHSSQATQNYSINIVAETSRRYQSSMDPWNNHIRNIAACSAAAMGNTQSIIVHPHDRITDHCVSDDATTGERMARNLPIVLARESGLTFVDDPLAGSYAIENLTQQLTELTWQSLSTMGNSHSWLANIRSGQWQANVAGTHSKRISMLQDQSRIVVGVNRYTASVDSVSNERAEKVRQEGTQKLAPVRDADTFEHSNNAASASI